MASCPPDRGPAPARKRGRCLGRGSLAETPSTGAVPAEAGNAIVEFVFLALFLMVPSVYALLVISHAQAGALAAVAAGQQAVQVIEAGDRSEVSARQAQAAAQFAAEDYGFPAEQVKTSLSCSGDCTGQKSLTVRVRVSVDLPLMGWLSSGGIITMDSSATSWGGTYE